VSVGARLRPFAARHADELWLALLLLVVLAAHLAIASTPRQASVFDETYYVPSARELLLGIVTNVEHPPLAKGLIALSILAFGDRPVAWRLPSLLAGTLAVLLLYLLTRRLADRRTALIAAFLLSFESLWFVHASIAMLDIVAVTIGLWALLYLVRGEWVWAGAVVGLAMLAKETMALLIGVAAIYAWACGARDTAWRQAARRAGAALFFVGVSAGVVFLAGLQVYDSAYDAFPNAFAHLARMIAHNRAIAAPALSDAVHPWQWFSGFRPSPYFVTSTAVSRDLQRVYVQYLGQPNLVILLLTWLAVPVLLGSARRRDPAVLLHAAILFVSLAFFSAVAFARITYPYYMLVTIPSVCVLVAVFLSRFPRPVLVAYGAGVVLWWMAWYPVNLLAYLH
jgi:predicted membrane-bound dolichyl-phosphate-mannose-protein mannosyltransferase